MQSTPTTHENRREQRNPKRRSVLGGVLVSSIALHAVAFGLYLLLPPPVHQPEAEQLIEVELGTPASEVKPVATVPAPQAPQPQPVPTQQFVAPTIPPPVIPPPPPQKPQIQPVIPHPVAPPPKPLPQPTLPKQVTKSYPPKPVVVPPKLVVPPEKTEAVEPTRPQTATPEKEPRFTKVPRQASSEGVKTTRRPSEEEAGVTDAPSRPTKRPNSARRPDKSYPDAPTSDSSNPSPSTADDSTPKLGERLARREPTDEPSDASTRNRNLNNLSSESGGTPGNSRGTRGQNDELAGTTGAGGERLTRARPRAGGGGGRNAGVFAYNDPTNKDPDRIAMSEGAGPGLNSGSGGGANGGVGGRRGATIGNDDGNLDRGALRTRAGSGIGADSGNTIGGGRRGRGGTGSGDVAGIGNGGRGGKGGNGSGGIGPGGRRGLRVAGDPFGKLGGQGPSGNGQPGNGDGGIGGPGGTRLASRPGGKGGDGDDDDADSRRGRGGLPIEGGTGSGRRGSGTGAESREASTDRAGLGGLGHGRNRARHEREHEKGSTIGRGLFPNGIQAEYYQDVDLSSKNYQTQQGRPIDWPTFTKLVRKQTDKTIDFDWGENPPVSGMKGVYWSARWTGKILVPKDDTYEFSFDELDDGGRLKLDGKTIIEVWNVQKSSPSSGQMQLKEGQHDIEIEYVQGPATKSSIRLMWKSTSFPKEPVGAYVDSE